MNILTENKEVNHQTSNLNMTEDVLMVSAALKDNILRTCCCFKLPSVIKATLNCSLRIFPLQRKKSGEGY